MGPDTAIPAPSPSSGSSPRYGLLGLFGALSVAALAVGGRLTSLGFGPWYDALNKPWFQPPGWVFAPVWTTIFVLLTLSTWQVARRPGSAGALRLYAVQLALNVCWSLFFFARHEPLTALLVIALLDAVVLAMVFAYGRIRRSAGWMLVPYAVWLGLASGINAWIVVHNP